MSPPGAPRLSRWKVALLAPLPLLVLLALLEGTLWLAGLGDPDERLSVTRGFSEQARYLLPDPAHPGAFITQMWDGSHPEQAIPPRTDRRRVLLLGGSNTMGFPTEYLQQQLDAAAPEPGFEVLNLGRSGYGSERVLILMRQVMALEPDVIFIYVGHNEFVERGFAMELVELWKQPWISRAVDRLSRLRTLNVAVSLLEGLRPAEGSPAQRPEARSMERGPEFQELRYEDTLLVYDCYRRNLEAMLRVAREQDVGVMLCTVAGNMLYPPIVPGRHELGGLLEHARARIPVRLRRGLIDTQGAPALRLQPRDWGESREAEALARRRAAAQALRLATDPPRLRPLAAPFDGGPYWTDPVLWNESPMQLLPTLAALHERRLSPEERAELEAAVAELEALRPRLPDQPALLHALGLAVYALGGRDEQAVQLLRDAARFDRAPTRGNDVTNDIVRALARAHPEVLVVDAEDVVRAACPSGLIGYELLMDNCHLHPAARPLLMDAFVPGLVELGRRP